MTATLTTAEVATALETTPRELRKFLRDEVGKVGKGARYALPGTARELTKIKKQFIAWNAAKAVKVEEADESVDED